MHLSWNFDGPALTLMMRPMFYAPGYAREKLPSFRKVPCEKSTEAIKACLKTKILPYLKKCAEVFGKTYPDYVK
jgi:hypothetical protein